jgi:hypothetical protein
VIHLVVHGVLGRCEECVDAQVLAEPFEGYLSGKGHAQTLGGFPVSGSSPLEPLVSFSNIMAAQ